LGCGMAERGRRKAVEVRIRRRLSPEQRREELLEGATSFFAEHGFKGDTRALAEHLGVSQGLIFRYFPTKDGLLREIFDRFSLADRQRGWERILKDTSLSVEDRLVGFYMSFLAEVDEPRWLRILLLASLDDYDMPSQYYRRYLDRLLRLVAQAVVAERRALGLTGSGGSAGRELALGLHAPFYYYLIRRHIYRFELGTLSEAAVRARVRGFLFGVLR
jgi:AcrR family transcriptional regulator